MHAEPSSLPRPWSWSGHGCHDHSWDSSCASIPTAPWPSLRSRSGVLQFLCGIGGLPLPLVQRTSLIVCPPPHGLRGIHLFHKYGHGFDNRGLDYQLLLVMGRYPSHSHGRVSLDRQSSSDRTICPILLPSPFTLTVARVPMPLLLPLSTSQKYIP